MITEAIQTTLSAAGLDAYGVNTGTSTDDLPGTPFVVHNSEMQNILRTKEGVAGYEHTLELMIVADEPSQVETTAVTVIAALVSMTGTINGTEIVEVLEEPDDPVEFDVEIQKYTKVLYYYILTNNR